MHHLCIHFAVLDFSQLIYILIFAVTPYYSSFLPADLMAYLTVSQSILSILIKRFLLSFIN